MYRLCSNVQNLSIYVTGLSLKMMCIPPLFVIEIISLVFFYFYFLCNMEQITTVHQSKENPIQLNQLRAFC